MSKFKVWFVFFIVFLYPVMVSAHPGKLDKNGCHTCRTNCSKWGLSDGQYHCHGGSSTNNKSTSNNTSNKTMNNSTTKKTSNVAQTNKSNNISSKKNKGVVKNTNASLMSLSVNSDIVDIKEYMEYRTSANVVQLEAQATDSKATVKYDSNIVLNDGSNKVNIKVIAEDTSIVKDYVVNIIKLNSDTDIKVYIDGRLTELNSNNVFNTYNDSIDIEYKTASEKATVEVKGYNGELNIGENIIKFIVTAEDGTKKEYFTVIKRNDINRINNIDNVSLLKKNYNTNLLYKLWVKIIYFIFHVI